MMNVLFWSGNVTVCVNKWIKKPLLAALLVGLVQYLFTVGLDFFYPTLLVQNLTCNLLVLRFHSVLPAFALSATYYTGDIIEAVCISRLPDDNIVVIWAVMLLTLIAWICVLVRISKKNSKTQFSKTQLFSFSTTQYGA